MARTLIETDRRIPDALRVAFGLCQRPPPAPGQHDEVANFAAVLLPPRDDGGTSEPMDCDEPVAPGGLRMVFESSYIRDHDEDAHFGHAEAGVVGVADGVGGYRGRVDASAFARGLMNNAYMEVVTAAPGTHVCPRTLLDRAHQATAAAGTAAASTAVIVSLAGRTLKWAYVGDSGFVVFRDGRILRRSQSQQHHFNCPYQLNSKPDGIRVAAAAAVGEVPAKEGDIVVVGTDGLFDNVTDDELERIVRMGTALGFSPKNFAEVLAGFAFEAARCTNRDTPFSVLGRRETGQAFPACGKPDDITVVVAHIVSHTTSDDIEIKPSQL